jgi:hypothetical protein
VISDNERDLMQKEKEGIGIQNMLSRTKECHVNFRLKKKEKVQLYHYHSNRTKLIPT